MKPWPQAWDDGLEAGAVASVLSAVVLAIASKQETGSSFACLNATSHWIWGDGAARHQEASVRHTIAGYAIHHAASCFWGVLYERVLGERTAGLSATPRVAAGLAAAAVACFVDYRVVPHRLSPGFELRLSRRAIAAGYLGFGLGLALAGMARTDRAPARRREDSAPEVARGAGPVERAMTP